MKNKTKLKLKFNCLSLCVLSAICARTFADEGSLADNLVFDEAMFGGSGVTPHILENLTSGDAILPGKYDNTKITMNGYQVGEATVEVIEKNKKSIICMSEDILEQAGFNDEYIKKLSDLGKKQSCVPLADIYLDFTVKLNSDLALAFTAPQSALRNKNGGIKESVLNRGENVIFSNYIFNYYHNKTTGQASGNSDSSYLSLNSGLNLGLWQLRHLSSYNYNSSRYRNGSSHSSNWYDISTYLQRPIYALKSNLILGKTNTSGQFFGGLSYTGAELSSDERMYPSSEQGYAPVITGIAKTNALVEVRQNGNLIYQTTVPPGNFDIRNLSSTSYNGDLNVTVIEADGSKTSFDVPFSAVPDSVRPGKIKYSIAGGKTRNLILDKSFIDSSLLYGLNNIMTLGGGIRVASAYRAGTISSVFTTQFGALGINGTYSQANLGGNNGTKQGWMSNITYSKTFQPTNTNIALAGYRYSTAGYREFTDFVYEQYYAREMGGSSWRSNSYLQKYRLSASIRQPLDEFGTLGLSASMQEYHGGRSRDITYQMNYNKMLFNRVSMGISVARQKTGYFYNNSNSTSTTDTLTMVSFSIPLGNSSSSVSSSIYMDKKNGNQYQTGLGGTLGDSMSPYSYNVNVNHASRSKQTSYSGNISKQYSLASVTVNGSQGKDYTQLGMGANGAVVIHSGGVLLGPYVGSTFGIVEAKGATGAQVYNGQGARINSSGYALVPSLTPYRYNSIGLTTEGMENNNVDIDASEQRISPYAGIAVKVEFNTKQGYPTLINLKTKNNTAIPIGATIGDEKNHNLGLVGQNNQAYFRADQAEGKINVVWGDKTDERCSVIYKIDEKLKDASLIKLTANCY